MTSRLRHKKETALNHFNIFDNIDPFLIMCENGLQIGSFKTKLQPFKNGQVCQKKTHPSLLNTKIPHTNLNNYFPPSPLSRLTNQKNTLQARNINKTAPFERLAWIAALDGSTPVEQNGLYFPINKLNTFWSSSSTLRLTFGFSFVHFHNN